MIQPRVVHVLPADGAAHDIAAAQADPTPGSAIGSDPEWKYVTLRRFFVFIEETLDAGLQWVVFEPNDEPLWSKVRATVSDFLLAQWREGALVGTRPEEAFFVKCDRTTMTQDDIDNGRLVCVIGIAPLKPAEFVILRFGAKTAGWRG